MFRPRHGMPNELHSFGLVGTLCCTHLTCLSTLSRTEASHSTAFTNPEPLPQRPAPRDHDSSSKLKGTLN